MSGYYIKKLIFTGNNVEDVSIEFIKGVNTVWGSSNTGKTYIYKCIDFMFGKQNPPDNIDEGKKYSSIYMVLQTGKNSIITVHRKRKKNSYLNVYRCSYDRIKDVQPNKYVQSTSAVNSMSSFYMELLGYEDKINIVYRKDETKQFTIRLFIKYFLLDEVRIIEERISPAFPSANHNNRVFEKNVLDYLLTGESTTKKRTKAQNESQRKIQNQLELLDLLIVENSDRLEKKESEITEKDIFDEAKSIVEVLKKNVDTVRQEINELTKQKIKLNTNVLENRVIASNLLEMKNRFKLLDEQYQNEIDRYEFVYEGSFLINQLPKRTCPICDNDILREDIDIDSMYEAMVSESQIIKAKQIDLRDSIADIISEISKLDFLWNEMLSEIISIENKIKSLSESKLSCLEKELNKYINQEQLILNIDSLRDELKRLENRRSKLQSKIVKPEKSNHDNIDVATVITENRELLCERIAYRLQAWKFDEAVFVEFAEQNEFTINGKARSSFGKGYRALFHAAYSLSLFELMKSIGVKSPNFIVLDSPLTSHTDNEVEEENEVIISDKVIKAFYNNLEMDFRDNQIIIIDNISPPATSNVHQIHFTRNNKIGRYGLFPME